MKTGTFIAQSWSQYELLDCGNGRKLERFGTVVLDRPEVNAENAPKWSAPKWKELADSKFNQTSANSGDWSKELPDWKIEYGTEFKLTLNLGQGKFKHVGVFPEQNYNWEYIFEALQHKNSAKALNLFAYTGAASVMAKAAGSDIIHVEAFSQLISKAKENMESSGLENVRWLREDALKFAVKEAKRERKYDMVIMDPPSWGRGPKGEVWKIDKNLPELIKSVSRILNPEAYLIVNTYSGIPPRNLAMKLQEHIQFRKIEAGQLVLQAKSGAEFVTGSLVRGQVL